MRWLLNKICIPKLNGTKSPTALVEIDALSQFDELRHKIVHREPFAETTKDIENTILLVACFGVAALGLVGKAYNLFERELFTAESFHLKYFLNVQNEVPEVRDLLSTLNTITESLKKINTIRSA